MQTSQIDDFVADLRGRGRVLVLGGGAVIALGLDRRTKDADIWLEPMDSCEVWSAKVVETLVNFPDCRLTRLFPPRDIPITELADAIHQDRVIRIMGLEKPLDIFREPNELQDFPFDEVWSKGEHFMGDVRLIPPSILIATKSNTNRPKDESDITFLRSILHERMIPELRICDGARARELLGDYFDIQVLEATLDNANPEVQAIGKVQLKQFAEEGDPFALDIWTQRFGPL